MIKLQNNSGFTLIELLITISIILLMTGAGIAGFINFNDRQQVQTTVNEIKDLMRSAQIKARAGEGASDCDNPATPAVVEKLKGYEVVEHTVEEVVLLNRVCVDPITGVETDVERSRITLKNVDVAIERLLPAPPASTYVNFLALRGGVDTGGNDATITVSGKYVTDIIYTFQVLQTGEITEGSFR